ncbi:MAG: hypothetical protein GY866_08870 [Proteobacteria bacterium]|nr:hypothetical protein [Pseudomonadota bacterium]
MRRVFPVLILAVFLCSQSSAVYAWGIEIGYNRLMPKLGTKEQEYEGLAGSKLHFKPRIEQTILGHSITMGFMYENFLFLYDQSQFDFEAAIPAENEAVTTDTDVEGKVTERRFGVNYHIERELAGVFMGVGLTNVEEELSGGGSKWTYKTITPYLKYGIDLIIGSFRVRTEQIHYKLGNHSAKVNSMGLLFTF